MNIVEKSSFWKMAWPFAHANYTTIGDTIYYPKDLPPSEFVIKHEEIHSTQMRDVGLFKFVFLYLFAFPVLWNRWRFKWEYEAYTKGSGFTDESARAILRSYKYGWLL